MGPIFNTFFGIILGFIIEIYLLYGLVCFRLNKHNHFALRTVLGSIGILSIGILESWLYNLIGENIAGRIAIYLSLFAFSTGHIKLMFNESYKTILLCCSLAYAAQNLAYKIFLIWWTFGEHSYWFYWSVPDFGVFYRLSYYTFFAIYCVILHFVFTKKLTLKLSEGNVKTRMLFNSILVLGITIILCSIEDVVFSQLIDSTSGTYPNNETYIFRQTSNIFSVLCNAIVLLLISRTIVTQELKQENEYLKYSIAQGQKQYEISKNTIDMINIKCHDIKYKINQALSEGGALSQEAVDDLSEQIKIYDTRIETENRLLNVLMTEKSLYCEQNNISFSCMIDGRQLSFIEDGDLYVMFSNIVDNALEAVKDINNKEKRIVNIIVKTKNNMLIIQEENYFNGEIKFGSDGLPETTKEDKNYHGFGTRSIRMIARKYDGEVSTYVKDDVFHLNIIFPQKS